MKALSEEVAISPRARALVEDLGSVEAIECLLVFVASPARSLSSREVASELRVTRDLEPTLEHLARLGLLDVKLGTKVGYRLSTSGDRREAVADLVSMYTTHRFAVIELLARPSPIRAFADAFRIRRKKPHG